MTWIQDELPFGDKPEEWECEYCGLITTSEEEYDNHTHTEE